MKILVTGGAGFLGSHLVEALHTGRIPEIDRRPARAGEVRHSRADLRLARRLFGWRPAVKLEDGLLDLLDWQRQQGLRSSATRPSRPLRPVMRAAPPNPA